MARDCSAVKATEVEEQRRGDRDRRADNGKCRSAPVIGHGVRLPGGYRWQSRLRASAGSGRENGWGYGFRTVAWRRLVGVGPEVRHGAAVER